MGDLRARRATTKMADLTITAPLTHPGTLFLLFCFEWPRRWWERISPFGMALEPGEVERRFGEYFEIERIAGTEKPDFSKLIARHAAYLMIRKGDRK